MSSRGRKAPGKKAKKGASTARKAPIAVLEGSPGVETKPTINKPGSNNSTTNFRGEYRRADSDLVAEGGQNGLSTPPLGAPRTVSPARPNGVTGAGHPGAQPDLREIDGCGSSVNGMSLSQAPTGPDEDMEHEDFEYKTWKQVTKKDRALVAAERHRLFKGNRVNKDEPALLRTRAGMRRWLRKQRQFAAEVTGADGISTEAAEEGGITQGGETLAEEMEDEEDRILPDYYDTLAAMPNVPDRLRWVEDGEGQLIDQTDEFLRVVPKGSFVAPVSALSKKMDGNMRQMQETRKVCSKIGIIKQMQLQSQVKFTLACFYVYLLALRKLASPC